MDLDIKWKEKAISLRKYGINELAWSREDLIELIEALKTKDIGVLGGDVYRLEKNSIIATDDNWYCEKNDGETSKAFYIRSKNEAIGFLSEYIENQGQNLVFSIVLTQHFI